MESRIKELHRRVQSGRYRAKPVKTVYLSGKFMLGGSSMSNRVGESLGIRFFDLDQEIESFFQTSIERLQNRYLSGHSFRSEAAKALVNLLGRQDSERSVIALPPSGLTGGYLRALKKVQSAVVVISDEPENIFKRIKFYDIDSRPIEKELTSYEEELYLKDIRKDISYFRKSYRRADLQVDISGLDANEAARKIIEKVRENVI